VTRRNTVGDRLFCALLRVLPEEVRGAYAADMAATFRAEQQDARRTGRRARLAALWLATIGDLARVAPAEHLDVLARDVRFALRTMAAHPAHTTTAVLTLAIAIAANVAMFAVVDAVLLAPLPYRDADRLVVVEEVSDRGLGTMGYLTFEDLRTRTRTMSHLAAVGGAGATLTGDGRDAERPSAMRVSASYFEMLGVPPALGRAFTGAEDRPGAARQVVMLSDALWRRRFDASPDVIGRVVLVNEVPHTVVGVMPPGFEDLVSARLYDGAELWFPLGYDPAASFACRSCRHLRAFGRLAPGVTPNEAERELSSIVQALASEHPREYNAPAAGVRPLAGHFLGPVRPVLLVLWAAVVALLIVACGNVANLLLIRGTERTHEIAVRAAMGVTRGRLARQLITESLLLAIAGGAVALVPAWAAVRWLASSGPAEVPRLAGAALDERAIAAAVVVAVASGLVFGLVPLRHMLGRGLGAVLQGAGRRTPATGTSRARATLLAGNVGMAVLLLVGAGLLVRSLTGLLAVAPGFDPSGTLTLNIGLGGAAYRTGEPADEVAATVQFYDDLLSRVRTLPGVEHAAATTVLPLSGRVDRYGLHIAGRPLANPEEAPAPDRFAVTPGFFAALRIPLVRGRLLDERDAQGAPLVAVVNQRLAEELFAGEDAIGHEIALGPPDAPRRRVVGVAGDIRHHGLDVPAEYQVYVPHAQWPWAETYMTVVVRTSGNPAALAGPVRQIVRQIDPAQPVTNVRVHDEVVAASIGTRRFAAWLLGVFASLALLLAIVGLSGALWVIVGQRRQEIGIRLALGARASEIGRMVIAQGLRPVMAGLAGGLAVAALSVEALRSLLYEVEALDPSTFLAAPLLLLACAIVACLAPAWHAAHVDPASALRAE
jgi:putative ABC transport system permease protein